MTGRYAALALAIVALAALLTVGGQANDEERQRMSGVSVNQPVASMRSSSSSGARAAQPLAPDGSGPVDHRSARLEDLDAADAPRPSRVRIDALGIDAPIVALGVAPSGEMEVPENAETVAWYAYGPSPGQAGSAVLAAHVDYDGRPGVFFRLTRLRAGDAVVVEFVDSHAQTFVVEERASISKKALPIDELFRREGAPTLTLITCGGDFDAATRSYRNNVVVLAAPERT